MPMLLWPPMHAPSTTVVLCSYLLVVVFAIALGAQSCVPFVPRAVVVGGGPAGALAACNLAKHGFKVTLLEKLPETGFASSRSFNFVVNPRGRDALLRAGVDLDVMPETAVAIKGFVRWSQTQRSLKGKGKGIKARPSSFGKSWSIERNEVARTLLDKAAQTQQFMRENKENGQGHTAAGGVTIRYDSTITAIDFEGSTVEFVSTTKSANQCKANNGKNNNSSSYNSGGKGGEDKDGNDELQSALTRETLSFDLLVGADGVNSGVRSILEQQGRVHVNYVQDDKYYFPVQLPDLFRRLRMHQIQEGNQSPNEKEERINMGRPNNDDLLLSEEEFEILRTSFHTWSAKSGEFICPPTVEGGIRGALILPYDFQKLGILRDTESKIKFLCESFPSFVACLKAAYAKESQSLADTREAQNTEEGSDVAKDVEKEEEVRRRAAVKWFVETFMNREPIPGGLSVFVDKLVVLANNNNNNNNNKNNHNDCSNSNTGITKTAAETESGSEKINSHKGRGVVCLVGDAGHGMRQSLGQGVNCALETCAVLDDCLSLHVTPLLSSPSPSRSLANDAPAFTYAGSADTTDTTETELSLLRKSEESAPRVGYRIGGYGNEAEFRDGLAKAMESFNERRLADAQGAVNLSLNGIGTAKDRSIRKTFILKAIVSQLLHKTVGSVPLLASLFPPLALTRLSNPEYSYGRLWRQLQRDDGRLKVLRNAAVLCMIWVLFPRISPFVASNIRAVAVASSSAVCVERVDAWLGFLRSVGSGVFSRAGLIYFRSMVALWVAVRLIMLRDRE